MAPIPNPHNDFVPYTGQMVMVIGGCHPRMLGKIGEVLSVVDRKDWCPHDEFSDKKMATILFFDELSHEFVSTSGELGNLVPLRILE